MMGFDKSFVVPGAVIIFAGILLMFIPKIPYFGKLPGDIHSKKDNIHLYVPIVTSLL